MNQLDPDLKRLMKWSRMASSSEREEAPFGFSHRVLACRRPARVPTLLEELKRIAWGLAGASLALILCGAVVWASQPSALTPVTEISSSLNFVATGLAQ